ncbi:MAG: MFS transporter [Actinomycetota bacterium]
MATEVSDRSAPTLYLLYGASAVMSLGNGAVFSLLAELRDRHDLPTGGLGIIAAAAFLTILVVQLTIARQADRGWGTAMMIGGAVLSGLAMLWTAAATELWQLVAARALLGAGTGLFLPAARRAVIVQATTGRAERLGLLYGAYLFGFVFGPPVAAALAAIGDVRLPFAVIGAVILALSAVVWRIPVPGEPAPDGERRVVRMLLRDRRVIAAVLVVVSFRYSIGVFEPVWAVYFSDRGASTLVIGLSLTIFALPMIVVAPWGGRFSDRNGARWASLVAGLITVPLMASYSLTSVIPVLILLAAVHGLFEAVESPGSQAAVAEAASDEHAASAQGLAEAAGSGAAAIGALTAAPLYDVTGGGVWIVGALVMGLLLGTSWLLDRPVRLGSSAQATSEAARTTSH